MDPAATSELICKGREGEGRGRRLRRRRGNVEGPEKGRQLLDRVKGGQANAVGVVEATGQ